MKPQFQNFGEFLQMGGYAPYVFTAFGLALATIFGLLLLGMKRSQEANKKLKILEGINDK